MPAQLPPYLLTSCRADLEQILPQIVAAADKERNSFGFMPAQAYATVALEGKLTAAKRCDDGTLMGYTLVGGTFPHARVFQTYVAPEYRGTGLGHQLVEAVLSRFEQLAYLTVRAEVAEDLEEANRFYRNLGFKTVRRKRGGEKSRRILIVRVRELATPNLLDAATFGHGSPRGLSIQIPTSAEAPLYLIDLNVFFDITKRRPRALHAGRVFAAAAENSVRVAIAEEFIEELERNTKEEAPDPTFELAKQLPRLPAPPAKVAKAHTEVLAPLLFPDRSRAGALTQRDRSDIRHLSTAIHEGVRGFVTSEKAILAHAEYFSREHGLDVLSPVTLGQDYTVGSDRLEPLQLSVEDRGLWCRAVGPTELDEIRELAAAQETPDPVTRSALASGTSAAPRRRIAFGSGQSLISFASWDAPRPAVIERRAYLFVDPTDAAAELALDYLLAAIIRDTATGAPSVIYLCPSPHDTLLRLRAIAFGFRPRAGASTRTGKLEKVCFGAVFTDENWKRRGAALGRATGLILPPEPPAYRDQSEHVSIVSHDHSQVNVSVADLENLLSPALFATGDRAAVIVPIKPEYAEELFSGSIQRSLLHENRAILLNEKRYFSHRRTYRTIPEDGLIVFYESGNRGGRSAAIAVGRIRRRYLATEAAANRLTVESGVLGSRSLQRMAAGKQVCVTEFDCVLRFKHPVTLPHLKEIGCADAANLVTARALPPLALKALLAQAFDHD